MPHLIHRGASSLWPRHDPLGKIDSRPASRSGSGQFRGVLAGSSDMPHQEPGLAVSAAAVALIATLRS